MPIVLRRTWPRAYSIAATAAPVRSSVLRKELPATMETPATPTLHAAPRDARVESPSTATTEMRVLSIPASPSPVVKAPPVQAPVMMEIHVRREKAAPTANAPVVHPWIATMATNAPMTFVKRV